jgi:CRP-like cAMP-binding protein
MARKTSERDPLLQLDLFANCTPAEARRLRSLVTLLTVEAGTELISNGTFGFEFLIIAAGQADVSVATPSGPVVVATLKAGDFAGEMSLLGRQRRSATVTATTPLTLYVANSAEFATMLEEAPSVAAKVRAAASARREANRAIAA